MAKKLGNGRGNLPRPGVETLELLANPLNGTLLKLLADGPKRLSELRRHNGAAPQTTIRAHLKGLEGAGLAVLQAREGSPRAIEWALTDEGRSLLDVAAPLERWLQAAPEGPIELGSDTSKMAVTALAGGWSSTMLCLLAAGPLSLTELAACINTVSYPSLERRLAAMRLAGQLKTAEREGAGTPYEVTEWLREGVAPLAAAVRWEYAHRPGTTPLTRSDTEAAFLLALPLLRLAPSLAGSCQLGVQVDDEDGSHCGALAEIELGRVVSCGVELGERADAHATGTPHEWAQAMVEASTAPLELHGQRKLANGLVDGLHDTMFGDGLEHAAL